jgi:hypothetical protein
MSRHITIPIVRRILSCALLACCSCSNTIYFYETEKISLTVEGRPDSTQPVQGNLGIKQRAVLIVPPKAGGEALSSISSFQFTKSPGGVFNFGPVTIRTTLVTGEAATKLTPNQQQSTARAIVEGAPLQSAEILAQKGIKRAKNTDKESRLRVLVKENPRWQDLSLEEKNELAEITIGVKNYGDHYTEEFHKAIAKELGRN